MWAFSISLSVEFNTRMIVVSWLCCVPAGLFTDSALIHTSSSLFPITFHTEVRIHRQPHGHLRSGERAHGYSHILSHPRLCCPGTPCPLHAVGSRLSGTFHDSPSLCGRGRDFSLCFAASSWLFCFYFFLVTVAARSRGAAPPPLPERKKPG